METLPKVHRQVAWNDELCARCAIFDGSEAVAADLKNFANVGNRLRSNRDFTIEAVGQLGQLLEFADESLRDDEDVVRAALQQDGLSLKFASERLRSDFAMAQLAVERDPGAIMFVDEKLRKTGSSSHLLVDPPESP